jgi:threonine 3-dehydrogenase
LTVSRQIDPSRGHGISRDLVFDVEASLGRRPRECRSLFLYAALAEEEGGTEIARAKRYRDPRISIESRPLNELKPGHLRVRMLRVGICGTDLHLVEQNSEGFILCTSPMIIPADGRIIGHEGVGVVEAVGPGSGMWAPGDVICCESIIVCGTCPRCRRGSFNQCDQAKLLGLEQDGLFTERADIPARLAHRVNDLARSAAALDGLACVEPAAVSLLACQNARVSPGDSVLVLGGGPIGYFAALLARRFFGASHVCVSDPSGNRRDFAGSVCDVVIDPEQLPSVSRPIDVVIEAAGALDQLDPLLARMNGNGRLVLLARTESSLTITSVHHLISKSLHLIGSRGHLGGAFDAILNLARDGRLDLQQVVTRVVSGLDGLSAALLDPAGLVANDCKVIAELGEWRGDAA